MTKEEQRRLKRAQEKERRRKEREAWEAARGPLDLPFLMLTLVLAVVGLIMLLSASFPWAQYDKGDPLHFFKRQAVFAAIGVFLMFWISKINYHRFEGLAKLAITASIVLLVLVVIPGPNKYHRLLALGENGAARWLGIPGTSFTFQPSEVAKLGIIVSFAASISKKRERMSKFREGFLPHVVILGVMTVLTAIEPHFSGAVLLFGIGAAMMVVGGIHWGWVAAGVGGLGAGCYTLLFTDIMEKIGYNSDRIKTWHDPWWDVGDKSYNMAQSLITVGSGGLWGVGLGKSRQKFMFLPERQNDFIFPVICEELGLVGATLILVLFAMLVVRGYWLAIHAKDRFGSLLVVGVITQIALQTFLNVAVVTGLIPATGISLPFFSFGGTALVIQFVEVGIVLSVSRQIPAPTGG